MLEVMLALTATTGLFALARLLKPNQRYEVNPALVISGRDDRGDDLPCPWCYGPTQENDQRCPECGQSFG